MQETAVMLSVECDCPLLADHASSTRMLEWMITSPELPNTPERVPFNLAILIDCSGSMRGEKLHLARQLVHALVDRLGEDDRAMLIAFADTARVLAPMQFVAADHRRLIDAGLDAVHSGGRTNLAHAWRTGHEALRQYASTTGDTRIVMLSDGLADCGLTGVRELAVQARANRDAGVHVSTIGIGSDHNARLLGTVALAGGGRYHPCGYAGAITGIARYELERLHAVIARDARLTIYVPGETTLTVPDIHLHTAITGGHEIVLGALCAGERRLVHACMLTPAAMAGTSICVLSTLTYACADNMPETITAEQTFRYVPAQQLDDRAVNVMVALRAVEAELAARARDDVYTYPVSHDDTPQVREPSAVYEARFLHAPRFLFVQAMRPTQSATDAEPAIRYLVVAGPTSVRQ